MQTTFKLYHKIIRQNIGCKPSFSDICSKRLRIIGQKFLLMISRCRRRRTKKNVRNSRGKIKCRYFVNCNVCVEKARQKVFPALLFFFLAPFFVVLLFFFESKFFSTFLGKEVIYFFKLFNYSRKKEKKFISYTVIFAFCFSNSIETKRRAFGYDSDYFKPPLSALGHESPLILEYIANDVMHDRYLSSEQKFILI